MPRLIDRPLMLPSPNFQHEHRSIRPSPRRRRTPDKLPVKQTHCQTSDQRSPQQSGCTTSPTPTSATPIRAECSGKTNSSLPVKPASEVPTASIAKVPTTTAHFIRILHGITEKQTPEVRPLFFDNFRPAAHFLTECLRQFCPRSARPSFIAILSPRSRTTGSSFEKYNPTNKSSFPSTAFPESKRSKPKRSNRTISPAPSAACSSP